MITFRSSAAGAITAAGLVLFASSSLADVKLFVGGELLGTYEDVQIRHLVDPDDGLATVSVTPGALLAEAGGVTDEDEDGCPAFEDDDDTNPEVCNDFDGDGIDDEVDDDIDGDGEPNETDVDDFDAAITTEAPVPADGGVGDCEAQSGVQQCGSFSLDGTDNGRVTSTLRGTTEVLSLRFVTGESQVLGRFNVAPTSATGHISRRMWISEQPAGAAIAACADRETSSAGTINWVVGSIRGYCGLSESTEYYLNFQNTAGCAASASCSFYRNITVN